MSGDEDEPESGDEIGVKKANMKEELKKVSANFDRLDKILLALGNNSAGLTETVSDLRTSLEFSQGEIEGLKEENRALKQKMADLELEGRGEEKIDKVETLTKRKNLILEGIPEPEGGREDVDKTVWHLFDQLKIGKGIDLEACYRQGYFNKHRCRPVVITFQKQADRDLVYANRMDLRRTQDFKQVWVNEDLGQASKKIGNILRLITKQAHAEGRDCRTGKYDIRIDRNRFDNNNLDELPPQIRPSKVKQIQLDKDTIAYQSEFACNRQSSTSFMNA